MQTFLVKLFVCMAKTIHAMPNTSSIFRSLFLLIFLSQTACSSDVETVENRDDQGRMERFSRRKKDFAKQGLYQKFYPDGKLSEEAHFVNDSLEGVRERRISSCLLYVAHKDQFNHLPRALIVT